MSYGATVELNGVMKMISPSSITSINAGQHYTFTSGQNKWHLTAVDELLFMTMARPDVPSRHAFALLDELQRTFVAKVGTKAETAREGGLSGETKPLSTKLCEKCDDRGHKRARGYEAEPPPPSLSQGTTTSRRSTRSTARWPRSTR